jgi:hypothetical protein
MCSRLEEREQLLVNLVFERRTQAVRRSWIDFQCGALDDLGQSMLNSQVITIVHISSQIEHKKLSLIDSLDLQDPFLTGSGAIAPRAKACR